MLPWCLVTLQLRHVLVMTSLTFIMLRTPQLLMNRAQQTAMTPRHNPISIPHQKKPRQRAMSPCHNPISIPIPHQKNPLQPAMTLTRNQPQQTMLHSRHFNHHPHSHMTPSNPQSALTPGQPSLLTPSDAHKMLTPLKEPHNSLHPATFLPFLTHSQLLSSPDKPQKIPRREGSRSLVDLLSSLSRSAALSRSLTRSSCY